MPRSSKGASKSASLPIGRAATPSIPGLAREDKLPVPEKRTEAVLQQHSRGTLANLGYHSLEIGLTRKMIKLKGLCPCCRREIELQGYPEGWQGNTPGAPDTYYFRWQNFPAVMIPVEMKRNANSVVRREQRQMVDAGRYPLAHTIRGVVQAVLDAEIQMDAYRLPPERKARIERFLIENDRNLW